jgi:hypothetical protein
VGRRASLSRPRPWQLRSYYIQAGVGPARGPAPPPAPRFSAAAAGRLHHRRGGGGAFFYFFCGASTPARQRLVKLKRRLILRQYFSPRPPPPSRLFPGIPLPGPPLCHCYTLAIGSGPFLLCCARGRKVFGNWTGLAIRHGARECVGMVGSSGGKETQRLRLGGVRESREWRR